jgi:hypothetical protein
MSCARIENKILPYVDGRLKESERLEMEKHLSTCAACQLRVNEFRAVSGFLDELPEIEPSTAFDVRVRARVAAEPARQSWWAWMTPSPRVALVATMLLAGIIWLGYERTPAIDVKGLDAQMMQDMQSLDDQDVISNFEPLKNLPQPVDAEQTDQTGEASPTNQTM